jgi:hypothetical protein
VITPAWVLEVWAALVLLVAEVSAGQLVVARAWTPGGSAGADLAVARVLTGIALAGVLVSALSTLPDTAWAVVFAVMTAWFAWCLWREGRGRGAAAVAGGRYAPQLVQSAALLYLFAALAGPSAESSGLAVQGTGGMAGMVGGTPGVHAPTLALLFALLLIAAAVRDLNRRAGAGGYFRTGGGAGSLAPAVVKGCQVATSVTLAFILIILI